MRLSGSAQVLEARQRRALALVQQGLTMNGLVRRLGCAAGSVKRRMRAHRRHGEAGLEVCDHHAHVSRLLARDDWTPQKPERRSRERDEAATER